MPVAFAHQHNKPFFRAALQSDGTLEILIYEDIGENWYGGGVTAKTVKEQVDRAGNYTKILVRINSNGGDAFEGIAIYNVLRAQKKPVEVAVDGLAASAASMIAMAGDTIVMGPNALMMIHNAMGGCMGFASDMRKMAEALDTISGAIAQTYTGHTGKTAEEILALMEAETWLTAQECLEQGFATAIVASSVIEENALAMARRSKTLARFKRVPDALKNKSPKPKAASGECEDDCQACQDGNCDECSNPDCDDPNCQDCPMQADGETENQVNLSSFEAELALRDRKRKI